MRPKVFGIVCLLLLTVGSPLAMASVGWGNPLAVYVTYPAGEYIIGSDVNVTVHVFREGVRYDPTSVVLNMGAMEREVPLTMASVGTYNGNFTIEEADIDYGSITMMAVVEDGLVIPDMAMGYTSIDFTTQSDRFQADINTPGDSPVIYKPGDTIQATVTFTFDGSPVDPDDGSLFCSLRGIGGDEEPLDLAKTSTGVYETSVDIPSELTDSVVYEIMVEAEYTPAGITFSANIGMDFAVDFYNLWVHYVEVTLEHTALEIYVLDLDNQTIAGAEVVANYTYYDSSWEEMTGQATDTTDDGGKASLTMDHADVDPSDAYLDIEGYAAHGGFRQLFDLYIPLTTEDGGVDPTEPFAVEILDDEPLPPATAMDVHFRAYSLGDPLGAKDVIVYIATNNAMVYTGVLTTDIDGYFTVPSITTPAVGADEWGTLLEADFQTQVLTEWISASEYYTVMEYNGMGEFDMWMDPETTISVAPFQSGGTVEVTLDNPDADGTDEQAMIMWGLGDPTEMWALPYAEWEMLNEGNFGLFGFPGILATWSDGAFRASFVFPEFLGVDVEVFVMGLILFGEWTDEDIRGAYVKDLVPLPANPAPAALITAPVAGEQYSGILAVTGTASDDTLVEGVEVRIDGAAWTAVTGTTAWSYQLNTTQLSSGTHMLEVRAYDGNKHSPVVSVVFEVDQPPTVAITSPAPDTRTGGTLSVAGTAADDNAVDRVEYRVDAGAWDPATGTTAWTAEVAVATLTSGVHTLEVRSSDGERTSQTASLTFVVDTRPAVTITAPSNASTVKKAFELKGTAADDVAVTTVQARLDGGAWTNITGTTAWSWTVPVKGLAEGDHTLEVRSWDGYAYSELSSVTFKYSKPEDSPGATAALAALALLGAVGAAHLAVQGRRR